ncbi:hypothetical protein [Aquimarina aquimarini]|uniref:hypothetical protein n=1 Tax=Aquimarina aquimarini TaxID=1191734 RepID=UPI000D559A4C|nr:hypothetical protein [Aquimarina aquimarini]
MSDRKKEFKKKLKNVPPEIFDEIKQLFAKYGVENIDIKDLKIIPRDNPTQEECEQQGKILECTYKGDGSSYCWCRKK